MGGRNKEVRSEGREKSKGERSRGRSISIHKQTHFDKQSTERQEHRKHKEMSEVHIVVDANVIFSRLSKRTQGVRWIRTTRRL